jgi:iron-sulfur cluster assembly protein
VYITRASSSVEERTKAPPEPISLTESALGHLCKLGEDKGFNPIVLRVGVKSGGCSGMSYVMDFVPAGEDGVQGDVVMAKADGRVEIRIDPKSLLYLFGLELDYSDELIGGGFKFQNPNAKNSCGCGTSFSV